MKGKTARHKIAALKRHRIRTRQRTEQELRSLASSWLAKPIHPIVCRPDLTVADGNCRIDGLELLGETEVEVFVTDEDLTDDQLTEIGLITAYHRSPLEGHEQALAIQKMKSARPGVTNKELAEQLNIDPAKITRLLSLFDCLPEVQEAAMAGEIGESDWYEIRKSPDQLVTLGLKRGGASREEMRKSGRKRAASAAPAVRTSKIKVPLVSGAVVTVAADEISLEEAIEAASEAVKQMKQAVAKGLNAKTAMNVWKDVAAAGA